MNILQAEYILTVVNKLRIYFKFKKKNKEQRWKLIEEAIRIETQFKSDLSHIVFYARGFKAGYWADEDGKGI